MHTHQRPNRSMVREFTRKFLLASSIPVALYILFAVIGGFILQMHVSKLLTHATEELNRDAKAELEALGQRVIQDKARDAARQVALFLELYPGMEMAALQRSPRFQQIAMQKVGKTGYVCLYEAGTGIMRLHPNQELVDREMNFLAAKIPSWWDIFKQSLTGEEVSGYYRWIEPDGSVRKKYMTMTPVAVPFKDRTLMVAATTYIDEFSTSVAAMEAKAEATTHRFHRFLSEQVLVAVTATALFLTGILICVYLVGRRTALHYMLPIVHLADTAEKFGDGNWDHTAEPDLMQREDEVGVLARSFESMRAQLHQLFRDLEDRLAELKQAQRSLQESEAHFRGLYDGVPVGLYRTSFDGRIIDANPTLVRMLGYPSKELFLSKRAEEMYANPADRFKWQTVIEVSGVKNVHEVRMRRFDRSVIWVENHSRTVRGKDGAILFIEGSLIDITDRKEMENQLQMAQRMEAIGTLAGGLAHDFNNLMMGILGNTSLMMMDMDEDSPNYEKLRKIENLVQSGSKLTSQLMGYARKGQIDIRAVDLNRIVQENVEIFSRTRKEIAVHMHLSPDACPVQVDRPQIEQVLFNLFVNAADAMPDGGDFTIETKLVQDDEIGTKPYRIHPGRYARIRVSDTGHGMDAETKNRIFDPFFTTKEMGRGTGLGLASAYGIVKAHAGYIDVESETGQGTVFTVYLPYSSMPLDQTRVKGGAVKFGQETILIVDDEEMVLEVGKEMVAKMGYRVLSAGNGELAVRMFQENPDGIDLVILDLIMPGISGGETFDRLRAIKPDQKILLASGYSIDSQARMLMKKEANGFIQKPYNLETLSQKIRSVLNS